MILIVDAILCLIVLEAAALLLLHRATGGGLSPRLALSTLIPGFLLLLAMRLALSGSAWLLVCGALFLALCAHAADLRARWLRPARPARSPPARSPRI